MGFKKFSADKLFDGYRFREAGSVLIMNDEARVEDIIHASEAGDDVEYLEGILTPGFINCHCHLELSHMKGAVPENTGVAEFVFSVVTQRQFPEEKILAAIEKAEDEMLANGIIAVGDICNNDFTIAQKAKSRMYYHNFIEASGFLPEMAVQRFESAVHFFNAFSKNYSFPAGGVAIGANSIVPHAPYSVSEELWQKIIHFSGNHLFSIHNQETAAENEWFKNKTGEFLRLYKKMNLDASFFNPSGKNSLQTYLPTFLSTQSVILVHNVHTSEEDIIFAKNSGRQLYWCLCPNANQYISRQLPDINLLMKYDCEMVLGTDSLASNHQLSILKEIKIIQKKFPAIEVETLLKWATSNGARALQTDSFLGSFEKGKRPGVILVDKKLESSCRIL